MNIQISIVFENVKYLTFYGSDYLTEQFPDTNVIPFADVVTKASYQVSLNKLWPGHKFNQFPLLENAKISRLGQYLQGEGTVTVDGVTYDVKLTPNSITATEQGGSDFMNPPAEEKVEEPVVDEKVEEPAVEEKVEEPAVEEEVEEPVPVVEEKVEEPEPVVVKEEPKPLSAPKLHIDIPSEVLTKGLQAMTKPPVEEPAPVVEKKAPTPAPAQVSSINHLVGARWGSNKGTLPKLGLSIGSSVTREGLTFHGQMPYPNTSEGFRNRRLKPTTVTGRPNNKQGNRQLFKSQPEYMQPEPKPLPVPEPPKPTDAEIEAQMEKDLMNAWNKAKFHKQVEQFENPKPITVNEEVVEVKAVTQAEKDARKAAKEAMRATLPEDINAVIGEIPLELLQSIPEFTANPVNTQQLADLGDIFCIDNRWHKQGKWFCVDVVCTKSRYFYNAKLGVSIDIPIDICKKWLEVVTM